MSGIEIILADRHGIYIPQLFMAENTEWAGILPYDRHAIAAGPEHNFYWEAWNAVLQSATYTDKEGFTWTLYQDGDLFAVCDVRMTDEEYQNFYGEPRFPDDQH